MRYPKGKRYFADIAEANQYRREIKSESCPHCGRRGALVCHGYLRGYGPGSKEQRDIRGYRFYCSDRRKAGKGCGKTYSILLAEYLGGWMIPADTLWGFIKGVCSGLSVKSAWEKLSSGFSLQSAYRIWKELQARQPRVRSRLHSLATAPPCSSSEPLLQLAGHLEAAFISRACPIAAYQLHFQRCFLE
jgi:hypothetical protein